MKKTLVNLCLAASLFLAVSSPSPLEGWGAVAHMTINLAAGANAGLPVSQELMGEFLAGATEPDLGCSEGLEGGDWELYHMYHDPAFVTAMRNVAAKKGSPEKERILARALGFETHQVNDGVAHGVTGYPNAKQVFNTVTQEENRLPNHIMTELMVDVLEYQKHKAALEKFPPKFVDVKTLVEFRNEYGRLKGKTIPSDEKALSQGLLKHSLTFQTELNLARFYAREKPELLKEMDAMFQDRVHGCDGKSGVADSVAATTAFFQKNPVPVTLPAGSRNLTEKAKAVAAGVVGGLSRAVVRGAEGLVLGLVRQEVVRNKLAPLVDKKVADSGNKMMVNFILNSTREGATLKSAILDAELVYRAGETHTTHRLPLLIMKRNALEAEAEKARQAWKNRPWWKFWLTFTKADEKAYLKAKAAYEACAAEVVRLSPAAAPTPASTATLVVEESQVTGSPEGGISQSRAAEIEKAYKTYLDAVKSGSRDLAEKAREAWLRLKKEQ